MEELDEKVKELLTKKTLALFLRPRGQGKTFFLKKLERYFTQERKIPVVYLSFGDRRYTYPSDLDCVVQSALKTLEIVYCIGKDENCEERDKNISEGERFARCITAIKEKTGKKCAILIDDYDFPLLDDNADENAKLHFESVLASLYGALQTHREYIETAFITGSFRQKSILQYAKADDVSENEELSACFGLKESAIADFARGDETKAKKLIDWYGGYEHNNCNAYSVISALNTDIIRHYTLAENEVQKAIENILLSSFDFSLLLQQNGVECSEEGFFLYDNCSISPLPYLYQAGIVTKIKNIEQFCAENTYFLSFPNKEMRDVFFTECARRLLSIKTHDIKMWAIDALRDIENDELRAFFTKVNGALKNICAKQLRDALTTIFGLFSIYTNSYFCNGYFSVETPTYLHIFAFDLVSMQNAADRIYVNTFASGNKKVKKTGVLINSEKGVISYRTM